MSGLKPTVIGLIAAALINLASGVFFPSGFGFGEIISYNFIASLIIFVICFILIIKKLHPIIMICIAAVMGILVGVINERFIA